MPILKKNRLLALEQTLHPDADKASKHKPSRHRRRKRKSRSSPPAAHQRRRSRVEARAFDWDEPIQLTYNGDTGSYVPDAVGQGHARSAQNGVESYGSQAFSLGDEDEAESFEVESFELDEDADSVTSNPHMRKGSQSFSAVDLEDEALAEDLDFSDLDAALEQDQPSRSQSDRDFAADLQAILSGEKTYDRDRGGMVKPDHDDDNWAAAASHTEAEDTPSASETVPNPHEMFSRMSQHMPHNQMGSTPMAQTKSQSAEVEAETPPHDVFDRMGHNMSYANSFDLGSISLEQRFDEFDEVLAKEERSRSRAKSFPIEDESSLQEVSAPLALDEAALEEDLALMHEVMTKEEEPKASAPDQKPTPKMHEAMAAGEEPELDKSTQAKENPNQTQDGDEATSD
ncbi:MAG: hypothetical protein QNJ46_05780 [Leptolyngbyaceae cyanobacterium MO_188.B28]|nr:hypothetical protein [Leptolyngbyaceae cyanobacterium MO_188.B28]